MADERLAEAIEKLAQLLLKGQGSAGGGAGASFPGTLSAALLGKDVGTRQIIPLPVDRDHPGLLVRDAMQLQRREFLPLSGSTDGRGILVTGTATGSSVIIHTAVSGKASLDLLHLWAVNMDTADIVVTIEHGGTTSPGDTIAYTVPFKDGPHPMGPGLPLRNGLVAKAFAGTGSKVSIFGLVERWSR